MPSAEAGRDAYPCHGDAASDGPQLPTSEQYTLAVNSAKRSANGSRRAGAFTHVRRTANGAAGTRLDAWLASWLPDAMARPSLSKSTIRKVILAGAVRVGDLVVRRPSWTMRPGVRVEVRIDPERLPAAGATTWSVTRGDILYQDDDVIAVAKPAGVQTHASADPARSDLFTAVREWLALHGHARSPYVAVHHRLDRDTSGIVLLALSPRANPALARAFAERHVEKVYHAVVWVGDRPMPDAWRCQRPLASCGTGRGSRMAATREPDARSAVTAFRVLERFGPAALVEARPETGRKHQIRAHLAESGHPILGDTRYGAPATPSCPAPRVLLHAAVLALAHPTTGVPLRLTCEWPDDFRAAVEGWRHREPS